MGKNHAGTYYGWVFALVFFISLTVFLTFFMADYFTRENNPNHRVAMENGALRLKMGRTGHYSVSGTLNDISVVFLLDTGATSVAVNQSVAEKAGLRKSYPVEVNTANGVVKGWLSQAAVISIGGVTVRDIPIMIMPKMDQEVLLGMEFLRRFSWEQEDGYLTLKKQTH